MGTAHCCRVKGHQISHIKSSLPIDLGTSGGCLTEHELTLFVEGGLPDVSLKKLAAHLTDCDSCAARVKTRFADCETICRTVSAPSLKTSESFADESALQDLAHLARRAAVAWPGEALPESKAPEVPAQIGRYSVVRAIGHGSFGTVYLARDPLIDREVAIKVPRYCHLSKAQIPLILTIC